MAGLVGRIALGKIFPGSSGAQDPEDAIEYVSRVSPRPASTVGSARRMSNKRL
jgi:hypothetical protein